MTDLRLLRIQEECDEGIRQVTEALKDMHAGLLPVMEFKKLRDRLDARVTLIEQQLADFKKEFTS